MASKKPLEPFEALYTRLEEAVAKLEGGNLSLEESLALYEDGMKLAVQCQELLQDAELRVTRLQEQFNTNGGTLREEAVGYEVDEGDEDEPGME
ncbi:MAG: exodeoxyribonuclease VII small subunit [Dehalococcoidia bacterium]